MITDFRRVLAQANATSQGIAASETTALQRRNALILLLLILSFMGFTLYYFSKKS
ncbi:MAG: hypothetical protein ACK4UP_02395 [Spirosomataceae bacterium]